MMKVIVMKEQSASHKKSASHEVDKRDLVNLDFYHNEILLMQHQLDSLTEHPGSAEAKKKVQHLKHLLADQKHNLDEFRKDFDVEKMISRHKLNLQDKKLKNQNETGEVINDENFFIHLQSFENTFKNIREEVLEFINQHA